MTSVGNAVAGESHNRRYRPEAPSWTDLSRECALSHPSVIPIMHEALSTFRYDYLMRVT